MTENLTLVIRTADQSRKAQVEVESAQSKAVTVGVAAVVVVVAVAFLIGRRAGRKRSAVLEIRRI
jgi:nitrate reductase gamma subunit